MATKYYVELLDRAVKQEITNPFCENNLLKNGLLIKRTCSSGFDGSIREVVGTFSSSEQAFDFAKSANIDVCYVMPNRPKANCNKALKWHYNGA